MNNHDIEDLLDKYQQGKATVEETELVESWLSNPELNQAAWNQMNAAGQDQWLRNIEVRINTTVDSKKGKVIPFYHQWRRVAAVAAILLVTLSTYLFWPSLHHFFSPQQLVSLKTSSQTTRKIVLADGSTVWLNAGSELQYAKVFTGKAREVFLTGEAYFDIQHDPGHPFLVHTGDVTTTVLGTAFNIKTDPQTHLLAVTVTRGKVSVSNAQGLLAMLAPDQQFIINTFSQVKQQQRVDAEQEIAWLQNDLYLDDVTFGEAARQLEERFTVIIRFHDPKAAGCRFTATLLKGKKLEDILKVICAFNHSNWQKQTNGTITIYGNKCQ